MENVYTCFLVHRDFVNIVKSPLEMAECPLLALVIHNFERLMGKTYKFS